MIAATVLKKGSLAVLFSVNAIALVNSVMTTHTLYRDEMGHSNADPTTFEIALMAPAITGAQWLLGKEERSKKVFDNTPVSFLADSSAETLPPMAHKSAGVIFAIATAPGAWVGTIAGMATGISSKYGHGIADIIRERMAPRA